MPRYALKIEYNGKPFAGWQRQVGPMSVQQAVEEALAVLQPDVGSIAAAGRTDAGVHARGQVAHVDLEKDWDPLILTNALNQHLKPHPVAIVSTAMVSDTFHARFSALERKYLFRVLHRRAPVVFEEGLVWQRTYPLDVEKMREGASFLLGKHDFTTFRSSICQAQSPVKTLDQLDVDSVETQNGTEYRFTVRARSFLHNQVRSFVGTLERVGAGGWAPERVKAALEACDRSQCGPVSPPHGLYLMDVRYPVDVFV